MKVTPRQEVIDVFSSRGEEYKLRWIDDMSDEQAMGSYYREYVDMYVVRTFPIRAFLRHSS